MIALSYLCFSVCPSVIPLQPTLISKLYFRPAASISGAFSESYLSGINGNPDMHRMLWRTIACISEFLPTCFIFIILNNLSWIQKNSNISFFHLFSSYAVGNGPFMCTASIGVVRTCPLQSRLQTIYLTTSVRTLVTLREINTQHWVAPYMFIKLN